MADDLALKVTLTGDGRRLSGTLENAQGEVRQFGDMSDRQGRRASAAMDRTGESVETVSGHLREMNGIGRAARSTLLGVGSALAGAFAAGSIRNQARAIADTNALSQALDVSTGKLQAWQYAGEQVGLQSDKMGDIFKDVSDKLGDMARTGGGEAVDLIEQMGLNIDKLIQRSPDQQLLQIGEALDGLTASERTFFLESLADEATRLQPLLENNAAGMREYTAEAWALGVAMDEGAVASAVKANRAMLQLEGSTTGLVNQLTADLGPGLAATVDDFTDWIESAGGAEAVLEDITDVVASTLAVLLAGRYAGALGTATAAKIAATQQAVAYQAALARMAGVSRGAAAAQMTMAGASRAAAGALALIGGPVGAAVVAAGGLYTFREELGLVPKQAVITTQRIDDLTDSINTNSKAAVEAGIVQLTAEYVRLGNQAKAAQARIDELTAAQQDDTRGARQNLQNMMQLEDTENSLKRIQAEQREAGKDANELREILESIGEQSVETADSLGELSETTEAAAESTDTFSSDLESLREQLDPAYAASQRLAEATVLLDQGLLSGAITLDEYLGLWNQAAERFINAGESAKDAANIVDDESDAMATLWERRLERMDDAGVDMWRSFIDGSDDAFSSFKRLAINTLAEVIHAYTTRPIIANVGANFGIGGSQGSQSGGFGGIPGLGSVANKAAGWLGLGSSSVGAAGTAAVGYGSGFGAAASTGTYTGWAGSAAAGAASSGGIMSGIGAAMPWVGAGLLADQVLGLGIVDGIVGGISSALGISGKYAGENPTGLLATRNQYGQAGRSGWERDAFATGALGDIGFAPDSRDIDTLFGDRGNFENAKAYAQQLAQLDNAIAQLAASESELAAMRQAAANQGLTDMSALEGRYTEILGTLDGEFGEFVSGLDGSIEEVVQQGVTARQAFVALSDASEHLDLRFDDTTASAYRAASSLADMVGGTQQLSALQANYYQTLYSEEERLNRLRSEVTRELNAMGMSLPRSREGFRSLVEAQNLNTEAGRANYAQLLQLVDGFDRLRESASSVNDETSELADKISGLKDDVKSAWETFDQQSFDQRITLLEMAGKSEEALALQRERELATIDESLRPFQERIWALQDEAQAQQEAAKAGQEYAQALANAQSSLGSTFENIAGWIDRNQSTDAGLNSPADQLAAAGAAYREQLEAAQGGDRSALQSITQYADRAIAAQKQWSASGGDTTALIDRIERELSELPDQVSAEEYIADEIKAALIEQTAGITSELADVLRSDTPSNIAGALAGSFDDLTRGIGDVLTREQLATVMAGKATDAQLDALMRTVDLNGDGVMSGLESVIIKSMPTDAALANALRQQLKANGNKALTAAEVRQALRPIASDQRIDQLIDRVDANGDGLLSAQELTSSRLGGLADGIAASLSGAFDQLDANLDDNLTFDELKDGLSGMATDAQLKALMRSMDVNADGVISGLESVVIKSMPTDSRLANVLRNQLKWTRNQQLTHDQVREALRPIASDESISRLIRRLDTNGDGIISAQEVGNVRLGGLADGIAASLSGSFDQLDANLDDSLTFAELKDGLSGMATDAQLRALMRSMDLNADGVISGLESVVIESMPSDSRLANVLRNQFKWTRNQQLTADQVRDALQGKASNERINQLIRRADTNADGIIDATELASDVTTSELSGVLAKQLGWTRDQIKWTRNQQLTADEVREALQGKASNERINQLIRRADTNADGIIDATELASDVATSELSGVLAKQLGWTRDQIKWTRNQQLTADQVHDALQGKASNERINQLIRRADTNADGIIDATELASDVTTSELSGVLAQQLGWTRNQIKWTRNQQLTADEVRDALQGKASNERINQLIRRADTNADGIIDATELASDASTSELSQVLSNQLKWTRNQIKWTRNSQLTHDQVREALSPIASNDEIDRLITRLDKNSDGIISAQEMASERLDGLAAGIGNALLPMFDTLDSSLDGLIDYDEFGKQFAGMASDEQLKKIFAQLDADGDGTISRLEALKGSTDQVDENTQSLEERALDQVTRLGNLVDEMTRTTDQFVDMNSTMVSLRDSINALGVAQEEQNRIERERREAKERQEKRLEKERAASGYLERANELEQQAQDQTLFDNLDGITAKRSDTIVDNIMAQAGNDKILSWDEYQSALDDMQTRRDKGWYNDGEFDFAKTAALSLRKQSRYHEMMDDAAGLTGDDYSGRIDRPNFGGVQEELKGLSDAERARSFFTRYSDYASSWKIWRGTLDYDWDRWTGNILTTPISDAALIRMAKELDRDFAGPKRFFAKGGVFTNTVVDQPTQFSIGEMGEAGPEAIMPLTRHADGGLGIRAELPPIPALPLLGQGDILQVLDDLRRENRRMREDLNRLLSENNQHAAAGVAVAQEGFKRVDRNTARIADSNDAIDDRQRLEAQR